jgi:hypothetical protein
MRATRLAVGAALLASACTDEEPPEIARDEQAIVFGDLAPTGALERLGTVKLQTPIPGTDRAHLCSGTLVTNRFVLTAQHCTIDETTMVLFEGPNGVQSLGVEAIVRAPPGPADRDFALITVATPAIVEGASNRMSHRLANPVTVGAPLLCPGYGCSTPGDRDTCAGAGTLRFASMSVSNVLGMIEVRRNAGLQVASYGDSGSSCHLVSSVLNMSQTSSITGAASYVFPVDPEVGHYTPPWTTKPWVEARVLAPVNAGYVFVPPLPPGNVVTSVLRAVDDELWLDFDGDLPLATGAFAPRGTVIAMEADGVPQGYLCSAPTADAPVAGALELSGTCVGIAAALASVASA